MAIRKANYSFLGHLDLDRMSRQTEKGFDLVPYRFPFARHCGLGNGVAGTGEARFEFFGGGFEFFDHGGGGLLGATGYPDNVFVGIEVESVPRSVVLRPNLGAEFARHEINDRRLRRVVPLIESVVILESALISKNKARVKIFTTRPW